MFFWFSGQAHQASFVQSSTRYLWRQKSERSDGIFTIYKPFQTYLGTLIQHNGKLKKIASRTKKASNTYSQLHQTIFGNKEIYQFIKTQLQKEIVEQNLICGGQICPARGKKTYKCSTIEEYFEIQDRLRNE